VLCSNGGLPPASETPGTQSSQALDIILSNVDMATDDTGPICQDTGMPTFVIHTPVGVNQIRIQKAILDAVAEARASANCGRIPWTHSPVRTACNKPRRRDAGRALRTMGSRTRLSQISLVSLSGVCFIIVG